MWSNLVGQRIGKPMKKEHDDYCVEEGFHLAIVKFNRHAKEGREALGMGYCSINTWNGLEMKVDWFRKNSSYFEKNFSISLLSCNLNTSVFKVCDALHWVHFLVMKIFSNIFRSTFCWTWQLIFDYDLYPSFL